MFIERRGEEEGDLADITCTGSALYALFLLPALKLSALLYFFVLFVRCDGRALARSPDNCFVDPPLSLQR